MYSMYIILYTLISFFNINVTFTFNLFRYNNYVPCYRKFNPSKFLCSVNQYYLTWSQLLKILYISIQLFIVSSDRHSYYTIFYILINLDENEKYIQNSTKVNSIIWIFHNFCPLQAPIIMSAQHSVRPNYVRPNNVR